MTQRRDEMMTRKSILVAMSLAATCVTAPTRSSAQLAEESGRVIEVLGSPTRVLTLGLESRRAGEPVIVLQAGAGSSLEGWGEWPVALSELAPVVGYDRPGLGRSPFDGVDPTPRRVAVHARAVLETLQVDPPYVLVGHSWGGPLILYFADGYPDEVVGMVYLDPMDPRASRSEMLLTDDEEEMDRREAAYDEAVAALPSTPLPPGRVAENRVRGEFKAWSAENGGVPIDLAVPTAVLLTTRTPSTDGAPYYISPEWFREYHRVRVDRFVDWSKDKPDTTLIVSTDAGHFIHLDEPILATAAVRQVLEKADQPK